MASRTPRLMTNDDGGQRAIRGLLEKQSTREPARAPVIIHRKNTDTRTKPRLFTKVANQTRLRARRALHWLRTASASLTKPDIAHDRRQCRYTIKKAALIPKIRKLAEL